MLIRVPSAKSGESGKEREKHFDRNMGEIVRGTPEKEEQGNNPRQDVWGAQASKL